MSDLWADELWRPDHETEATYLIKKQSGGEQHSGRLWMRVRPADDAARVELTIDCSADHLSEVTNSLSQTFDRGTESAPPVRGAEVDVEVSFEPPEPAPEAVGLWVAELYDLVFKRYAAPR